MKLTGINSYYIVCKLCIGAVLILYTLLSFSSNKSSFSNFNEEGLLEKIRLHRWNFIAASFSSFFYKYCNLLLMCKNVTGNNHTECQKNIHVYYPLYICLHKFFIKLYTKKHDVNGFSKRMNKKEPWLFLFHIWLYMPRQSTFQSNLVSTLFHGTSYGFIKMNFNQDTWMNNQHSEKTK